MKRTFNPQDFDIIFSYPQFSEGLKPEEWLENDDNVALVDERGLVVFRHEYPGVYSGHMYCTVRGREALDTVTEALSFMFDDKAKVVIGWVDVWNKPSRWACRKLGFTSYGIIETLYGPHELFILTKEEFNGRNH